ncbi:hypothetical protein AB4212_00380 [Streptomyces sp. 2MCAF27]
MSGRHAHRPAEGRALTVLGILGIMPPVLIVGPQLVDAHAAPARPGVSQPDATPKTLHQEAPHTCRCAPRTAL